VVEPFEQVIRCYKNPNLAMKKRAKRRLDYEKYTLLKNGGKKVDKQLAELVEQYDALNDTLKKELPKLSAFTAKIGNICLGKFVVIQAKWYAIWKDKVKAPLQDTTRGPELSAILSSFSTDFRLMEEVAMGIGILNPAVRTSRASQSTNDDSASTFSKRSRPGDLTPRGRGLSINSDSVPSLPAPDFGKRSSGQLPLSPGLPSPGHAYYRDYYNTVNGHARGGSSPLTPNMPSSHTGSHAMAMTGSQRPSTGRSYEPSAAGPRPSTDSNIHSSVHSSRRDSSSTHNSHSHSPFPGHESQHQHQHQHQHQQHRLSGLFHSALPPSDGTEESQRTSRASSRERGTTNGYTVLWWAASLFEFKIETTKHEAGYPYLTYQAGEVCSRSPSASPSSIRVL
jgi:hypothetical protein